MSERVSVTFRQPIDKKIDLRNARDGQSGCVEIAADVIANKETTNEDVEYE
jgi:hypothetical protein